MSTDQVLYEVSNTTALLTFNRPQARNALTFEMYDALADICQKLNQDSGSIRALILTGAGEKAFAAGTDISQFRRFSTPQDALDYEHKMDRVLGALESLSIPTIAAIRGACTGGGAAIAGCCDIRIATADLKFGFPIARTLGNCLSVNNLSRLTGLLGAARTKEIIFTSRLIESAEALNIALVSEVVDDVLQRAREIADKISNHAPLTMSATKEGLRRLRQHAAEVEDDDLIVKCYTSSDFHEGIEAFLAKRNPDWKGS